MQTSELDQKNNTDTGDVENINFRPSPNFKHMRKYLKAHSSPYQSSDRSTSPPNEEQEQVNGESETAQASTSSMAQPGQPPLPPNSPPPDLVVPKQELVVPKQEVKDEEYTEKATLKLEPKVENGEVKSDKPPEKTMCRQFARGTCTRGSSCIYVHELILTQLPGVYTFCKNFLNSICKFPMCKFVHATVFEKEQFYRTGFLPPHSLAHLNESNSALAPPSTPAEAPPAKSMELMNPPPTMHPGVSALLLSGTSPPEVLPLSEMSGPWPTPFHLDNTRNEFECGTCDLLTYKLQLEEQLYKELLKIKQKRLKKVIKKKEREARLVKVFAHVLKNMYPRGNGPSRSISDSEMEARLEALLTGDRS